MLYQENATYPWYPASVTKLMTMYVALKAVKEGRMQLDTAAHGLADRGLAGALEDGLQAGHHRHAGERAGDDDGEVGQRHGRGDRRGRRRLDREILRRDEQERAAPRHDADDLRQSERPACGRPDHLGARSWRCWRAPIIRDLPEYEYFTHIPAIRFGRRVTRNFNSLIGRYPGADGMKTGFICASGFNLVASATRNSKRMIAVVLGAPSSPVRAAKAAQLLERGFARTSGLSWLTPSLGTLAAMEPIAAEPPNLRDDMCGPKRKRPGIESDDDNVAIAAAARNERAGDKRRSRCSSPPACRRR